MASQVSLFDPRDEKKKKASWRVHRGRWSVRSGYFHFFLVFLLQLTVELLLPGGCPKVVYFDFVDQKGMLWFFSSFFCQFIINHCVCRNPTRRQICSLSRASGAVVVVCGPSVVSVEFQLVCSWLLCSGGFWLRLFVARFWLAEVGCRYRCSSTWSVLLSVVSGREVLCDPLERWGRRQVVSSRHSATGGRRVMRARLVFWRSGSWWHGCKCC